MGRVALTIAALVCVALAGCSAPQDLPVSPGNQTTGEETDNAASTGDVEFTDLGGAGKEYLEAVATFPYPLPEGIHFPERAPSNWAEDMRIGVGTGKGVADGFWQCAWLNAFVEAETSEDETAALDMLEKWTSMPFYRDYVVEAPGAGWQEMVIDPARLGDATVLKMFQRQC